MLVSENCGIRKEEKGKELATGDLLEGVSPPCFGFLGVKGLVIEGRDRELMKYIVDFVGD